MEQSHRDQRSLPSLEMLVQDVRYGVRTLSRTPAFTAAALLTLALGIGATTAIFSVVNAVLLRPLPYPEPGRLVQLVRNRNPSTGSQDGRRYLFFREHLRSVEALAAYRGAGSMNMVRGDTARFVSVQGVSKEFFAVFGVQPALGGPFTIEHDVDGGPDVVILTDALWRSGFGASPDVIGTSILLADKPHTVVGVMPRFESLQPVDLLVPLRPGLSGFGGGFNYTVVGRARPGVTVDQASGEAESVWRAFDAAFPGTSRPGELPTGFLALQDSLASAVRSSLLVMAGAVGLLLLIACANTANLLLARAAARGREAAVRAALGAGRARIIRQVLTESLLIAVSGGTLGLAFAYWSVPALLALTPSSYLITDDVRIDGTVLAVTAVLTIGTGILFGLAPALGVSRRNLVEAFKDDGTRSTGSRESGWLRRVLVTAETALCMLLLVGAALLLQTFLRLRAVDPGFDSQGVLTARVSLQGERYATPAALNRLYDEGLERIRRIPGIRAAAVVNGVPLERALNLNVDVLDGPEKVEDEVTDWRYASPDYFAVLRAPIVAGRGFTAADRTGSPAVAVVSEQFARRFFKGSSPLGRHIRVYDADGPIEIVGVVRDLKEGGLRWRPLPVMYVPVAQAGAAAIRTTHRYYHASWVVRADDTAALRHRIEEELRAVAPGLPIALFRTMDEAKSRAIAEERFQLTLLSAFAGVGLILASAGIYGLIAYSVTQRTRELGIRMALGASRVRILRSILAQGMLLSGSGVIIGGAVAVMATRTLRNLVWGVSTADPATFIVVGVLLLIVAALASLIPAVRALRVSPVQALRG